MTDRQAPKKLSKDLRKDNFSEVRSVLPPHLAMLEAARCLFCNDAPCSKKCPANVDIVNFIRKIKTKNLTGAIKLIREKNPFAGSCARICPQTALCESGCNSTSLVAPIAIGELQRFVADSEKNIVYTKKELTGKKVLIIGGGPAGLSTAYGLRKNGVSVRIIEKNDRLGGGLSLYIPDYRLPKDIVTKEINAIIAMGDIEVLLKTEIKNLTPLYDEFDAVFISTGLMRPKKMGIPGENSSGVFIAEDLLEEIIKENAAGSEALKKRFSAKLVCVIGGGNVAMDISSSLIRFDAEVNVLYRRSEKEMPAWKKDYDEAIEDGARFYFLANPVEIKAGSVRVRMMKLGAPDASGRPLPTEIPGSDFEIPTDYIIYALGKAADYSILEGIPGALKDGNPRVNEETKNIEGTKIYIGGDFLNNGDTVVSAVSDGMRVSQEILKRLGI